MILLRTYSEYPDDWSEEDQEWEDKLKKRAIKSKRNRKIENIALGASVVGGSAASIIDAADKLSKYTGLFKMGTKTKAGLLGAGLAGGTLLGMKQNKIEKYKPTSYDGRRNRYKKMDKDHRDWIRKYDPDPSKFIDWKYYKQGGYKPYRKNDNTKK